MATQINNSVSATYGYGREGRDSAVSNVATTNLIEEYAISGTKNALNSFFRAGDNITYQITVRNDGTSPLYTVTVSDNLGGATTPLSYVVSSATLNVNGTNTPITPISTNPLTFNLPNPLAAGEVATITYVARVSSTIDPGVTQITNSATISAREGSAAGPVISVTPNPTVTLPIEDYAQVSINKAVSTNEILPGQTFSYTLTLENSGNLDATGVVLTDALPTGFTISSITSVSGGTQTTFTPADYTVDPATNTLTLPNNTSAQTITVPAATGTSSGETVVTITGSIN